MRISFRGCVVIAAFLVQSVPAILAQNTTGSIKALVVDPNNASITAAQAVLSNAATGIAIKAATNTAGSLNFASVPTGDYSLSVEAAGFEKYTRAGIHISSGDIRDLGSLQLTIGAITQSVAVTDAVTPLQAASGERSGTVSGEQLKSLALKGRDFFALAGLLPGVVDVSTTGRDATSPNSLSGVIINGGRDESKNFTVDGVSAIDTGGGNTVHFEPNMDSIAEVKILSANYQAEYGRNAGGTISVVTRGGGSQFHGSAWWTHRHEQFNANNFFNNANRLPRTRYRFNVAGFSVGGPVIAPVPTLRHKLFFFASQEYTRQLVSFGANYIQMPTALERAGDFSRSLAANGSLIVVKDPTTGNPFPGNLIPANRINTVGQSILKFYPLPNYTDPNPALALQRNYAIDATGAHPRRNDMLRIDWNPFQNLRGFFRWVRDTDTVASPYVAYNFGVHPFYNPQPGHGYAASATWVITPTLLNETTLGKSWNSSENYPVSFNGIQRNDIGPIPQLFTNVAITGSADETRDGTLMPNISFGGTPINPPTASPNNNQHTNHNDTWDLVDNLSYVRGLHQFKGGIFVNLSNKVQVSGSQWNGTFNFGTSSSNPNESGNAYANAILGNFQTYTESTRPIAFDANFESVEFYIQDNWRVRPSFTLDYGIRFYHIGPQSDMNFSQAGFAPQLYDPSKAPRLYYPYLNPQGQRVGIDTVTGSQVGAALIGKYVPGTGSTSNGLVVGGVNGFTAGLFTVTPINVAPRFGFAWKTPGVKNLVVRGGIGVFFDRTRQLITSGTTANAPVSFAPTVYYGNLATLAQSAGALGASSISSAQVISGVKMPSTTSYSLGLQKELPGGFLADAAFVGSYSRHLLDSRNINPVPLYSQFDPANLDTTTKTPLPDDFFRRYRGLSNINIFEFASNANYNALQTSIQRRFAGRVGFGTSYTFSKVLGVASAYSSSISSYFNARHYNYGPLSYDRNQVLKMNYSYDIPNAARYLGDGTGRKLLSPVLSGWTVSGVTSFISGAPFTPTFTTTNSQNITGSTDGPRITVVGDPNSVPAGQRTIYHTFNTAAFVVTPVGSFGNAAPGLLRGPGIQNWDFSLKKDVPLGLGERRVLQLRAEAYNAFNRTNFTTVSTAAQFNPTTGAQTNANFGAYTAAAPGRILSFSARLQF